MSKELELKVKFNMDNAAFDGEDGGKQEAVRLLRKIVDEIESGVTGAYIFDVNGNRIGEWDAEIPEPEEVEPCTVEYYDDEDGEHYAVEDHDGEILEVFKVEDYESDDEAYEAACADCNARNEESGASSPAP